MLLNSPEFGKFARLPEVWRLRLPFQTSATIQPGVLIVELDDELCLCFHVTKRKVVNFLRLERPQVPSQLSECHGAGTGCGWCRTALARLYEDFRSGTLGDQNEPTAVEHRQGRRDYVLAGGGTPPPGATPIDDD